MDLRIFFVTATAFVLVNCENVTSIAPIPLTASSGTMIPEETTTVALPNLCTVCDCIERFVNCSYRALENHFEASQWPTTAMDVVTFKANALVYLKPFPAVSITKLILQHNRITKIQTGAFKQLFNLTELDLSYNELTSQMLKPHVFQGKFSPESYEPLSKLTVLNLAHNLLHTLNQDVFEHVTNIKILTLSHNPLEVIDGQTTIAISSLYYLEELDISNCHIKSLSDHLFYSPRNLKRLNLSGNRFTVPPIALDDAKELEYLYLDENPIEIIDSVNSFPKLPKLKELSLCCMPHLTEIRKHAFSGLTGLESLHVQNCPKLKIIDEDALVQSMSEGAFWPPLKKLDLSDNALQYLPAQLVGRWDRLEELDLMNNEWSCDCDNQYLIGELLPHLGKKLMEEEANELTCANPPEHAGKNLTSLANHKLRCLDLYNARPERDAAVLIGILIGLLLAIPVGLAFFTLWRRGYFFCGRQGPASFSRAFYKRTSNEDDI